MSCSFDGIVDSSGSNSGKVCRILDTCIEDFGGSKVRISFFKESGE